jgi:beta propeller repeat protein
MRAADLFQQSVEQIQKPVEQYRSSINPPYKTHDFLTLATSLFLLLALPITVIASLQVREPGAAAATREEGLLRTGKVTEFVSNELLIKVKKEVRHKVKQGNPASVGIASINRINKKHRVSRFERPVKKGKNSNEKAGLFSWFKIKIPGKKVKVIGRLDQKKGKLIAKGDAAKSMQPLIRDLNNDPNIKVVEPNYAIEVFLTPNDPYYSSSGSWNLNPDLWGMHIIKTAGAWDQTTGSKNIIVANIDSGVDRNHEDLQGNMWVNTGETPNNGIDDDGNGYVDDYHGWDFYNNDNDPMDDYGHGTHTAGTIAAVGNNEVGVVGVNWDSRLMALKIFNDGDGGNASIAAPAIRYAADMGAKVSSNSWGCWCRSQSIKDAMSYAYSKNMVIVAAAGNDEEDVSGFEPANLPEVITVAATQYSNEDERVWFSNYGEKIDVAAPGVRIISLRAEGTDMYGWGGFHFVPYQMPSDPNAKYYIASGTSMAAPHVSGLAALILAKNPQFTNEEVRLVLRNTADDLGEPGFDVYFGAGRINAAKALKLNSITTVNFDYSNSLDLSHKDSVDLRGTASGPDLSNYQLSYGVGDGPTNWIPIGTFSEPIIDGVLGVWNVKELDVGLYTVKLSAADNQGIVFETSLLAFKEEWVFPLTDIPVMSRYPTGMSGTKLVYSDRRTGNEDVYLYDFITKQERQITNNVGHQLGPIIDGDKVIWSDFRNDPRKVFAEIYMYDLSTNEEEKVPIKSGNSADLQGYDISGDIIVWGDNENDKIYYYDLSEETERQVQGGDFREQYPRISGDKIVWAQEGPGYQNDIYLRNLTTGSIEVVSTNPAYQSDLDISGDKIVWMDDRYRNAGVNHFTDIYMYDLSTNEEQRITTDVSVGPGCPGISGNLVVWRGDPLNDSYNTDIFLYDLNTNTMKQVTAQENWKSCPVVSEGRIVWGDSRDDPSRLYFYKPKTSLKIIDPDVDDNGVVDLMNDIFGVAFHFDKTCDDADFNPAYDMDGNCKIEISDIYTVADAFGLHWPPDQGIFQEGGTLHFWVKGINSGDTPTYSMTGLPDNASLNSTTGEFSWTPNSTQSGSYTATFTVDDGNGGTDTKTLPIKVTDVP